MMRPLEQIGYRTLAHPDRQAERGTVLSSIRRLAQCLPVVG
jgi:hypothetical protein